jgi:hypothetical protein
VRRPLAKAVSVSLLNIRPMDDAHRFGFRFLSRSFSEIHSSVLGSVLVGSGVESILVY